MLGLSLLLATQVSLQPADSVTITVPASSVPVALERLQPEIGISLEASQELNDEFLTLHLEEADGQEVLERIAKAMEAVWERRENGYRLTRTAEQWRARRDRMNERLLQDLTEELEKEVEFEFLSMEQAAERVADEERVLSLFLQPGNQNATHVLAHKLAQAIGPEPFLELGLEERAVWSLDPTPAQRQLPPEAEKHIADYRRAIEPYVFAAPDNIQIKNGLANYVNEPGAELLFVASHVGPGNISLQPLPNTTDGVQLLRSLSRLQFGWQNRRPEPYQGEPGPEFEAKELYELWKSVLEVPETPELLQTRNEKYQLLLDEEGPDFVLSLPSALLLQVAEHEDRQLVASMDQETFLPLVMHALSSPESLGIYEALYAVQAQGQNLARGEEWLIGTAEHSLNTDEHKAFHRPTLRALLELELRPTGPTLDELAEVAASAPTTEAMQSGISAMSMFVGEQTEIGGISVAPLRLYGSMNEVERASARTDEGLRVAPANLSTEPRRLLAELVFGRAGGYGNADGRRIEVTEMFPEALNSVNEVWVMVQPDIRFMLRNESGRGVRTDLRSFAANLESGNMEHYGEVRVDGGEELSVFAFLSPERFSASRMSVYSTLSDGYQPVSELSETVLDYVRHVARTHPNATGGRAGMPPRPVEAPPQNP